MIRSLLITVALGFLAGAPQAGAGSPSQNERVRFEESGDLSSIDAELVQLEAESSELRTAAFERLIELGPSAALRALVEASAAGVRARRARALLVVRVGGAECVPGAVNWLGAREGDADVRRTLIEFLARTDLADDFGEERAAALAKVARADSEPELMAFAIEALSAFRNPDAGQELDRLVDDLPEVYRASAAEALINTAVGRRAILRRISDLRAGAAEPAAEVLAVLIAGYGRTLADLSNVGEVLADLTPIVVLSRHADDRVRVGARLGLENLISRVSQTSTSERTALVFDGLESAGWNTLDLEYRRALLALRFTSEPGQSLESARRVQASAKSKPGREAARFRFFGQYFEAVGLAASGRPDLAEPHLDRALAILDALSSARVDLLPEESKSSDLRAREATEYLRLGALVELMRAASLLLTGKSAKDLEVLETVRNSHARLLIAQLTATRLGVDYACDLDAILDHDLGPRRLMYDNATNPNLSRERGIELMRSIGQAFATVARTEMPGFAPLELDPSELVSEGRLDALSNPIVDPDRFALLLNYQFALRRRLSEEGRRMDLTERARRQLWIRRQMIEQNVQAAEAKVEEGERREEAYAYLTRERNPSQLALWLARDLRVEGRPIETRELAERLLEDLRESGLIYPALESEIGLVVAASFTEEGRPENAETTLLGVLEELGASVTQFEEDRDKARENNELELAAAYDDLIRRTELRLSDCLVSLAVNANVRMGDREKALAYFDRAFELNKSDFMRALLACYRARSGRMEEARIQLREVSPAPPLYYNMACTYALLGEPELALDFLQRDFEENQQSAGALVRQKMWASDDPDLKSLRELKRFQTLVEVR